MANTTTITKLSNGSILVETASEKYTLTPDSALRKKVDNIIVISKSNGSALDTFITSDILKVIREDTTEIIINGDTDLLFSELSTFFFFKLAGGGGNSPNLIHLGEFTNYTDLITQFPIPPNGTVGTLAYVLNSQGTPWLPGSMLGTFYSKGTYAWTGTIWDSAVDDIAKALEDIETETALGLSGVLTRSNKTSDGQSFQALNGTSKLNLRDASDNNIRLSSDMLDVNTGIITNAGMQIADFGTPFVSFSTDIDGVDTVGQSMFMFGSYAYWWSFDNTVVGSEIQGGFNIYNNRLSDGVVTLGTKDSFPTSGSVNQAIMKMGVLNTFVGGGTHITAKTSNAIYSYKYIFNKNHEAFETVLDAIKPTADRNVLLQDKDGTIALLSDIGVSSDQAAVQINRSTSLVVTSVPAVFTSDSAEVENIPAEVSWDIANPERITVLQDGVYLINASISADNSSAQNETLVLELDLNGIQSGDIVTTIITKSASSAINPSRVVMLSANDYLSFRASETTGSGDITIEPNAKFSVVRLTGEKGNTGAKGDNGSGSNIVIKKDGVTVGTVADTINFTGIGLEITDEGSNQIAVEAGLISYTNANMLLILNPPKGRRIWNDTWKKIYYFDGDVWLTEGLIKSVNANATTMQEGNPVFQDSATDLGVQLSSTNGSIAIYGVVKDVYGTPTAGATGEFVTIAVGGICNVLCNGTVIRNQLVSQSSTIGEADSSGTGASGSFGITKSTRSGVGSSLVKCVLQPTERFKLWDKV